MTWMWFFEQGKNKIRFSSNSLESQDIANSYSMKELKKNISKQGKYPNYGNLPDRGLPQETMVKLNGSWEAILLKISSWKTG